jgi:DNA-binding MarR family transcriptional regulator
MRQTRNGRKLKAQAVALDRGIATLFQRYKLEPGIAAGSPFASLHANDVGLLVALASGSDWHVRRIAQMLRAPMTTVSSVLDRLEARRLLARRRRRGDRRMVYVELTARGCKLAKKVHASQVSMCAKMLAGLRARDRKEMIRLVTLIAQTR